MPSATFRKPNKIRAVFVLVGVFILLYGGVWVAIFNLSQPNIDAIHKSIVGAPLPKNANHVAYNAPSFFNQWTESYVIISYNVDKIDLSEMAPQGFSTWEHLKELYVGHHFFNDRQMPHAWISSLETRKMYSAIIVDLDHNQVFVISSDK